MRPFVWLRKMFAWVLGHLGWDEDAAREESTRRDDFVPLSVTRLEERRVLSTASISNTLIDDLGVDLGEVVATDEADLTEYEQTLEEAHNREAAGDEFQTFLTENLNQLWATVGESDSGNAGSSTSTLQSPFTPLDAGQGNWHSVADTLHDSFSTSLDGEDITSIVSTHDDLFDDQSLADLHGATNWDDIQQSAEPFDADEGDEFAQRFTSTISTHVEQLTTLVSQSDQFHYQQVVGAQHDLLTQHLDDIDSSSAENWTSTTDFDAVAEQVATTVQETAAASPDWTTTTDTNPAPATPAASTVAPHEVIFVDSRVSDYESLVDGAREGAEVVILDANRDGLEQIAEYLAGRQDIAAIHIVSHGSSGQLILGSTVVTNENLSQYTATLNAIGGTLTGDGDILFYGCNLGEGDRGAAFIAELAALTQADIAASLDYTGASFLGGNWVLETTTGTVEAALAFTATAQANYGYVLTTFTVSTTVDESDGDFSGGDLSLREAIEQANLNPGADTIILAAGTYDLTLLASGDLDITDDLTIIGAGADVTIIDGVANDRVFDIAAGKVVAVQGVTISNGSAVQGGGIQNAGDLTLDSVVVTGNQASFLGGGIHNAGTLTVTNSTISQNTNAGDGGGISSLGSLTVTNSTLSGNQATSRGGGIYIGGGSLVLTNSTVTGNVADVDDTDGTQTVAEGGGVFGAANETVNNTIIAGNFVNSGAAQVASDVDTDEFGNDLIEVSNNNLIGDAASSSNITDGVNGNIVGNSGVGTIDINTVLDTMLDDNGGPTPTHALLPGSTAIDAGSNAMAVDGMSNPLSTDQRGAGFDRIIDGDNDTIATVDIGAYESAALTLNFEIDTNGDLLIEDLADAGNNWQLQLDSGPDPDEIVLVDLGNGNAELGRIKVTDITGDEIIVRGNGGDDTLTVDFSAGDFLTANGLTLSFAGGETGETNGDEIIINGGTFGAITYNITGDEAGNFAFDGTSSIAFTELEPAKITSVAGTVTINVDDGNGTAGETLAYELTDGGNAGDGMLFLDLPGALEDLTFAAPTVELVINGDVDDDDQLTVTSVDTGFDAGIDVDLGGGIDSINFDTTVSLTGSHGVSFVADVIALNGADITTAAGTVTLTANQAGTATGNFVGVTLDNSTITSATGNINLSGRGGDTGSFNTGVLLENGSLVESTGTGAGAATILITGIGGSGVDSNEGVVLISGAQVLSTDGDIQIDGTGGDASGARNRGILIANSLVTSTGTTADAADITIAGIGDDGGTNENAGVFITGPATVISTVNGDVEITGTGGDNAGNRNLGVQLEGAVVESTGTGMLAGSITIDGAAGEGTSQNIGIHILGNTARIESVDGDIQIDATAAGTGVGAGHTGLLIENGIIESTGTGAGAATITLNGTAGSGTSGINGVLLRAGATVNSTDGDVDITGTSPSGGIAVDLATAVETTGSADITINAVGSGLFALNTGLGSATATGNFTITADLINISGSAVVQSTGDLLIQPLTTGRTIGLGDAATGQLNLTATELSSLQDGFASITIGAADAGDVDVNAFTFLDPVTIRGGSTTVTGLAAGANDITLISTGSIDEEADDAIPDITTTGTLTMTAVGAIGDDADTTNAPLDIAVGTLVATTSAPGEIFIRNSGALTVQNVTSNDGDIFIQSMADLTVQTAIANSDLTLIADTGDLDVDTASAAGGTATLTATAGAVTDANGAANNVTAATLVVTADSGIDLDTDVDTILATTTTSGTIDLNETDGVTLGDISAAAALNLTAAGNVDQQAASAITGTGTSTFDVGAANNLTLTEAGNDFIGAVTVVSGAAVTLVDMNALTLDGVTADDTFQANAGASLTVDGALAADNGVTLLANMGVTLNAGLSTTDSNVIIDADVDDDANGEFTTAALGTIDTGVGAGNVLIIASDVNIHILSGIDTGTGDIDLRPSQTATTISINDTAGDFDVSAAELQQLETTGTVTIGVGGGTGAVEIADNADIDLTSTTYDLTIIGGTTTFNGELAIADNHTLTLQSTGAIVNDNAGSNHIVIGGGSGTLVIEADGAAGTSGTNLVATVDRAAIIAGGDGIFLDNATALEITAANSITGATTRAGSDGEIEINTVDANLTVSEQVAADGAGTVMLNAGTADISSNSGGTISSASGDITLTSATIELGDNVSSSSGALLLLPTGVSSSIGIGDTATGDYNLTDTEIAFLQDGFSSITIGHASGTGDVDINAVTFLDDVTIIGGSFTVTGLDAGANMVTLVATDVTDGGDVATDITGGTVEITAETGIGLGDALEIDADSIDATNNTSGGVFLNAVGTGGVAITAQANVAGDVDIDGTEEVTLPDVDAANGAIMVDIAGAGIIATDVVAAGTGNDITLTTTAGGSIELGTVTADGDMVTIDSGAAVTDDDNNATQVTAQAVVIAAVGAIGAAGATANVDTKASTLSANAGGTVDILEEDGLTLNNSGAANRFALTTVNTGDLTLNGITATGGGSVILLNVADGAIIDGNAGATNLTADGAALQAVGGIGNGNALETAVANLAAANTTSGAIDVTDTNGGLTVGSVTITGGTLAGVTNVGGGITLVANSPMTINAAVTDTGGGDIVLTSTNDGGNDDHLTINAEVQASGGDGSITLNAGTDLIINDSGMAGDVSVVGNGTITATAVRSTQLGADVNVVSAGGDITFNTDRMLIDVSGTPATIDAGTGNVTIAPTSGGDAIALDLGSTTDVAANTLELSDAELDQISAGVVIIGSADAGAATVTSALTLANNLTIETGADSITVDATIDGNFDLTLNSSGTTDLNAALGSGTALASLTTNSDGTTEVGANVSVQGSGMTFDDTVELTSSVTLTGLTGAAADFNDTVDGPFNLTLAVTGDSTFAAAVGSSTPLGTGTGAAIVINSTGATNFQSTLETANGITQAGAAGLVTFSGDVTTAGTTANQFDANVTLDGVTFMSDTSSTFGDAGSDVLTVAVASTIDVTPNAASSLSVVSGTVLDADLTVFVADTSSSLSGIVSGPGGLIKDGVGTLELSAANTYQGTTTVAAGMLNVTNNTALGANTGGTSVEDGATLQLSGVDIGNENLQLSGAGVGGAGALLSTGTAEVNGTIDLQSTSIVGVTGAAGQLTLTGVISGAGLNKEGAGLLILSGDNTYTGATDILTGTLQVNHDNALGTTAAGTSVQDGATLAINTADIGSEALTLNGAGDGGVGAVNALVDSQSAGAITLETTSTINVGAGLSFTIDGAIGESSGPDGLTKIGDGTLIVNAANTYTGNTEINAGDFQLNGSTAAASIVNVNNSSRLTGNGTAGGPVNVAATATIAPGNGPGTLTTGNIDFNEDGIFNVEIDGTDGAGVVDGHDQLDVDGTVNIDNDVILDLDLAALTLGGGEQFIIVDNDGDADAVTGRFVVDFDADGTALVGSTRTLNEGEIVLNDFGGSGQAARITYAGGDGNDVVLIVQGGAIIVNGTVGDDVFTIVRSGQNLQVYNGTTLVDSRPISSGHTININGLAGSDTLYVVLTDDDVDTDFNNDFLGQINFDGGSGGVAENDELIITNNDTTTGRASVDAVAGVAVIGSITHNFTNANDGNVEIDDDGVGGQSSFFITYVGLEPITQSVEVEDVTLNYAATADSITIDQDAAATTRTLITAMNGLNPTAESVSFINPTESLTINAGAGADTIDIDGFGSSTGGFNATFTVDGQADFDTINLNTDITLGSAVAGNTGDLTFAADTIIIDNSAIDTTTATNNGQTGDVVFSADRNIAMTSGTSITTLDGDVTLSANPAGLGTGNFAGILLTNTSITSGMGGTNAGGDISLTAQGGDTGSSNVGVFIRTGSTIVGTGLDSAGPSAGSITITGTAGAGDDFNDGVRIEGVGTEVSTVDGNLLITGFGGSNQSAGSDFNRGVIVRLGAVIVSSGIDDGGENAGTVTISGTGADGNDFNAGVQLEGSGTLVTSIDGNVAITGNGGTNFANVGDSNYGVRVLSEAQVTSTGQDDPASGRTAALVTIAGNGAAGGNANAGVVIEGSNTRVSTIDGDVIIEGTGWSDGAAAGDSNIGVWIAFDATVASTGLDIGDRTGGEITISGTAGAGDDNNIGVRIDSNIETVDGNLSVTGAGTSNEFAGSDDNRGVLITTGGSVSSTGEDIAGRTAADIVINGIGGAGEDDNDGILLQGSVSSVDGNLTLSGTGGSDQSSLFGRERNRGVAISGTITTTNGQAEVRGSGGDEGSGNIGVLFASTGSVSSTGLDNGVDTVGTVSIIGTGGLGAVNNDGVEIFGNVASADGDILIAGTGGDGSVAGSMFNTGVSLLGTVSSTGSDLPGRTAATITITGIGGTADFGNAGVVIQNAGTAIDSIDGDITITGTAGDATAFGVSIAGGAPAVLSDTADIDVNAAAGDVAMLSDAEIRSTSGGTVTIVSTSDDVLLGDVESIGGLVRVTAGGMIRDNLSTEAANITAAEAALRAGTGIGDGVAGNVSDIDTTNSAGNFTLAATTESGDINIHNVGSLTIDTVDSLDGVTIVDIVGNDSGLDDIALVAASPLTVNEDISNHDGGDIVLTALTSGDVTINADVQATGDVTPGDDGQIVVTSQGGNISHNTGTVSTVAGDNASTSGQIQFNAAETVVIGDGNATNGAAVISTVNGNIDIDASPTSAGTAVTLADAAVIAANEVQILTVNGNIDIDGTGSASGTASRGVLVNSGTNIESAGTAAGVGAITISGTSGAGAADSDGVQVEGATTTVTAENANVTIVGVSMSAFGNDNDGTEVSSGASVTATGAGAVAISGTGAGATSSNDGVDIESGASVSTLSGMLNLTGDGGSGTSDKNGVRIDGAGTIVTTTSGDVIIEGTAVSGVGNLNDGVQVSNDAAVSATGVGTVSIIGSGGGATAANHGVAILSGADVSTTTGTLDISGTDGGGTGSNDGVRIDGADTTVTSEGAITISGTADSPGADNDGVRIAGAAAVSATNNGTVTIDGEGGGATNGNDGVSIVSAANVSTQNGTLEVTGTGGVATTGNSDGVRIDGASTLVTTVDGAVTVIGTATTNSGAGNEGVEVSNSATVSATGVGTVSITGDGAGATTSNEGVSIESGAAIATVGGELEVTGRCGAGASSVDIVIDNSTLQTVDGTVLVTGETNDVLMQNGSVINSDEGDAIITAADDVLLEVVNLDVDGAANSGTDSAGTLFVTATAGAISDNETTAGDTVANVTAAGTVFQAATGVGSDTNAEDDIDTVTAIDNGANPFVLAGANSSGTGGFFVSNTGDLEVGTTALPVSLQPPANVVGITTQGGIVQVSSITNQTVNSPIDSNGGLIDLDAGSNIDVNATTNSDGGNVDLDAGVDIDVDAAVTSSGGDVIIDAGEDVRSSAPGTITTTAVAANSGSVTITASTAAAGIVNLAGTIDTRGADNGVGAGFDGGMVTIGATANGAAITVADITTDGGDGTGAVGGNAGNVMIDNQNGNVQNVIIAGTIQSLGGGGTTAGSDGTISVFTDGAIRDAGGTDKVLISGTADLDAGTGIGDLDPLETQVKFLTADTVSGNIDIDNMTADLADVMSLTTGDGNIDFDQTGGGDVQFSGTVSSGTDGSTDGGSITLTGANGLAVTNTSTVSSLDDVGGTGMLTIDGATIEGAITVGAGDIFIQGGALDTIIAAALSSPGAIGLTALRDVIIQALVETTGAADITVMADRDADMVGGVHIDESATRDTQVNSGRDIIISGADLFADGTSNTTRESIVVDADGAADQIISDGNITLQPTVSAPAAADVIVNGRVHSSAVAGTIDITANQDVFFGADGDLIGSGGQITVIADAAGGNTGGQITMVDGTRIEAAAGDIELTADGNIDLAELFTTNEVRLTTSSGSILDNLTAETANITAATIALRAETGIDTDDGVNADDINTTGASGSLLLAAETDSGDIIVTNLGHLTIDTVDGLVGVTILDQMPDNDSGNDNITLLAASPLTVNEAVTNNDGGNITLTAATSGQLSINADVSTLGNTGGIDLNAGRADFTADLQSDGGEINLADVNNVVIAGTITFDSDFGDDDAGGDIAFSTNTVAGHQLDADAASRTLTIDARGDTDGGTVTLGAVTPDATNGGGVRLDELTVRTDGAGGVINVQGAVVETANAQTYDGPVIVDSPTIPTSDTTTFDGTNLTFQSTLRGSADDVETVNLIDDGRTILNGEVGGAGGRLVDLTTDTTGNGLGVTEIRAGVTTSGTQTYHDAVELDAAANVVTLTSGVDAIFQQTVRSVTDGEEQFIVNADGVTRFVGNVGDNAQRLRRLETDSDAAAGTTEIGANINTVGTIEAIRFGDDVALINGPVVITAEAVNAIPVAPEADVVFERTVNGGQDLTLNVDGVTTFAGTVGATTAVGDGNGAAITINSAGTTEFQQTVETASGLLQDDAAGEITFREDVSVAAGDTDTTFNADVTLDGLTFTSNGGLDLQFGNDTSTDSLTLSGGDVTIDVNTGAAGDESLDVQAAVDGGQELILSVDGTTTFRGTVGATTALGDGTGAAITVNSLGTTEFQQTVRTASGIVQTDAANANLNDVTFREDVTVLVGGDTGSRFDGDVVLDGMTFLHSSVDAANPGVTFGDGVGSDVVTLSADDVTVTVNGDDLLVRSTVDGGQDLILNVAGMTTFQNTVGATTPIGDGSGAAITINSAGATEFQQTVRTASGIVQTDAAIANLNDVTFRENVTVLAGGDAGSRFDGDVLLDGMTFLHSTVDAANPGLTFGDGSGSDAVTLATDDVTITVNGDDLLVRSTIDGGQDLTLNVTGSSTFENTVGATAAIGDGTGAALQINSTGTTLFADTIATASGITQDNDAGEVTFEDDVDIAAGDTATFFNADVTIDGGATAPDPLNFTSLSDVTFGSDASDELTLIPDVNFFITGAAVFNATVNNVGGVGDFVLVVGSFTVDQTFDTNGGNFILTTTTGDVDFNANGQINTQGVAQDGNVSITANVGAITMVDGATVNSGMGTIFFSAPTGTVQLTGLSTTNTTDTAVRIVAGDMVTDGGDTNVDINANSGRVVIESVNGVGTTAGLGADNAIETQVESVDIENSAAGSVVLTEADNLAIFNITTPDFVDLDVTNGAITDDNVAATPDIQASGVALRAMNGIGDGDAIDTAAQVFAASNSGGGNIEIFNTGAGIIGTVNGLVGITNADPALGGGDIIVTNASPLTVDAPVLNSTSGDIMLTSRNDGDLTVNRQVRATGGDGSIMLDAGDGTLRINNDPTAADELQVEGAGMIIGEPSAATEVAGGVFFRSGTGRVSSTVPNLVIDPLSDGDIPDVTNTGVAEVSFEYGRAGEENFTTVVEFGVLAPGNAAVFETSVVGRSDTGEGTAPETFTPAGRGFVVTEAMPLNPGRTTFDNTGPDGNGSFLEGNPNPENASAAVLMRITVINDPNISIGSSEVVFVVSAAIPGEGIGAVIVDSGGAVQELTFPDEGDTTLAVGNITPVSLSSQAEQIVQRVVEAALSSGRQIIIHPITPTGERVTAIDENGNDTLVEIELDESVLNDLTRLFAELPDGRYRIYLREAGEERLRLLFDINVRSGKITSIERVVEGGEGDAADENGEPGNDDQQQERQGRGEANDEQRRPAEGESETSEESTAVPQEQSSSSAAAAQQSELDRRWSRWMPGERSDAAIAAQDATRRSLALSAVGADKESIPTREDLASGLALPADSTYTLLAGGAVLIAGRWTSRAAARKSAADVDAAMEALDESKLSRAARLCRKLREEEL